MGKTILYYFSGTGNSLAVAKGIAEKTKSTLMPIASLEGKATIKTEADIIGIIFPTYLAQLQGIPLVVERFVKKLENINATYIFAVCTCGGFELVNGLPTLKRLNKLIRLSGGKLAAEFTIKLPMNNLSYPSKLINQNQAIMFKESQEKIGQICQIITNRESDPHRTPKLLFNYFMTPAYILLGNFYVSHLKKMAKLKDDIALIEKIKLSYKMSYKPRYDLGYKPSYKSSYKPSYKKLIQLSDRAIIVDDQCTGCGICAKVCPVQNIEIIDNKPTFQHHCEMCIACDEWCPERAIHHWCKTIGKDYHHPKIDLSDMLNQREEAITN